MGGTILSREPFAIQEVSCRFTLSNQSVFLTAWLQSWFENGTHGGSHSPSERPLNLGNIRADLPGGMTLVCGQQCTGKSLVRSLEYLINVQTNLQDLKLHVWFTGVKCELWWHRWRWARSIRSVLRTIGHSFFDVTVEYSNPLPQGQ